MGRQAAAAAASLAGLGRRGAGAPGTLRASLSGCSGPLGSASWLMAAASSCEARPARGRGGRARERGGPGARALTGRVPVPSPLVLPGSTGGDVMGGEAAVPAAPPPPPPAGPARPAGPPSEVGARGRLPASGDARRPVVRGSLPAAPGRCVLHPPPARLQGPRVGARQRSSTA